jgi:ketosteroid isomerase-like protein
MLRMPDAMSQLDPPIRAMFDATNAEDSTAFVESFAEDAVLVDWGRTFTGHEEIATWNANENIGVHSRIGVTSVERDGDRTTVGVSVSGEGYNGGGAFVFETAGGRITRMEISG